MLSSVLPIQQKLPLHSKDVIYDRKKYAANKSVIMHLARGVVVNYNHTRL